MFTTGEDNSKIPLCIFKNRENFSCDEKQYHILFIESGSGSITYLGHKELFMAPLIFCFSEEEVPRFTKSINLISRSIYLSPEFVNNRFTFDKLKNPSEDFSITDMRDRNWFRVFFERPERYFGRINLNLVTAKRMSNLFDQIQDQLEKQPDYYWPCRSRSFLIEILFLLEQSRFVESNRSNPFTSGYSEEVEKVILYLYSNYESKITISKLVTTFNTDRNTLTKKFKEEVGDSVINSLIKLRINLAASLLRDTLIPISEIIYRVGFSDISHFNRTFKKQNGFNPSEYRQQNNILIN